MENTGTLNKAQIDQLVKKYPAMEYIAMFRGTIGEFYEPFKEAFKALSIARKDKLIRAVCRAAQDVFSSSEITSIQNSLNTNFMVSTAEHHASITYSQSLNIVLNQFLIQNVHKLPLISLSCSTTTLDNELFPRGVFYDYEKLPFLAASYKSLFVYNAPPIKPETFKAKVKTLVNANAVDNEEAAYLNTWFDEEYEYLKHLPSLHEQISVLNKHLWRAMVDSELHYPEFDYFMIPSEKTAYYMLLEDSSSAAPSWVYRAIFEPELRQKLLFALDGVRLCWDILSGKGTFLFWGFTENQKPVQLFLDNNFIISKCGTVSIELKPDKVLNAIERKIIVPASNLFFLYAVFFAGITALGGILQVNYLTDMKQKLNENNPLELSEEDMEIIKSPITNIYVNFQGLKWNEGGLKKLRSKFTAQCLKEYEKCDHFGQIQECLGYLVEL